MEVGALPDRYGVLANLPDIPERLGINLGLEGSCDGLEVVRGDARELPWPDGYFDLVVCASTLEHIPDFWRACAEMKRVLAARGTALISTPGFAELRGESRMHRLARRLGLPDVAVRGTVTMRVHDTHDFYRFSEDAYREVIMSGLEDVRIWRIMLPPRIFGMGTKGA